jgi:hypothetical protein
MKCGAPKSLLVNNIGSQSFQLMSVSRSGLIGTSTSNLDWHILLIVAVMEANSPLKRR